MAAEKLKINHKAQK